MPENDRNDRISRWGHCNSSLVCLRKKRIGEQIKEQYGKYKHIQIELLEMKYSF